MGSTQDRSVAVYAYPDRARFIVLCQRDRVLSDDLDVPTSVTDLPQGNRETPTAIGPEHCKTGAGGVVYPQSALIVDIESGRNSGDFAGAWGRTVLRWHTVVREVHMPRAAPVWDLVSECTPCSRALDEVEPAFDDLGLHGGFRGLGWCRGARWRGSCGRGGVRGHTSAQCDKPSDEDRTCSGLPG